MLKLMGIVLILLSGAGLGFGQSMALTQREKNLEGILRMTMLLKGEIRCGNASLGDAFSGISGRLGGELGAFLKTLSRRMEAGSGRSFGELFRECAGEILDGMQLSSRERESVYALGESLGYLDLEMQLRELELFQRELEFSLQELRREMPSRRKLYQSLGIFGAALLAVMLW